MELDLDIVPEDTCEREFQKVIPNFNLTTTKICARAELHRDGCGGDSGGPLMHLTKNAIYDVIGITSFGNKACDSSSPGVYTRVSSYLDWIANTVEDTLLKS
jgi:secreted trypsin-like serine protease